MVGISADGALWEIPFQALIGPGGRHLIEDHAVFMTPSLTVLAESERRRESAGRGLKRLLAAGAAENAAVAAGLKTLPETERELGRLGQWYGGEGTQVLERGEASEDRWKREAPEYRVLHLATHGVLREDVPLRSYLVLSPGGEDDGKLEAQEILGMRLKAELAVLSACETARGQVHGGEGMIGMSWAFLAAGCPSTLVSQWKVESASTSELMVGMHRRLKETGEGLRGKAEALRQSALELRKQPKWAHPFYWAGFVLIGDGY